MSDQETDSPHSSEMEQEAPYLLPEEMLKPPSSPCHPHHLPPITLPTPCDGTPSSSSEVTSQPQSTSMPFDETSQPHSLSSDKIPQQPSCSSEVKSQPPSFPSFRILTPQELSSSSSEVTSQPPSSSSEGTSSSPWKVISQPQSPSPPWKETAQSQASAASSDPCGVSTPASPEAYVSSAPASPEADVLAEPDVLAVPDVLAAPVSPDSGSSDSVIYVNMYQASPVLG